LCGAPCGRLLLNETRVATELKRYRALTGYDPEYSAYCQRYGFHHHVELRSDGISVQRRS
jgi:hypothetical protein